MAREVEVEKAPVSVERTGSRPVFIPAVDIFENVEGTVLLADMPGVEAKDLQISVEEGILSISATVEPVECKGYDEALYGYRAGDYHRCFTLGEDVDLDKIEAAMKDGVLRLVLPRSERARPRKIEIKTVQG